MSEFQKEAVDFFAKRPVKVREEPAFFKMWSMLLFALVKMVKSVKLPHFLAGVLFVTLCSFANSYLNPSSEIIEAQKEVKLVAEQTKQKELDFISAKSKTAEDKIQQIKDQKIAAVKAISQEDFNKIKEHIMKTRDNELRKINEIYWTYIYAFKSNGKSYKADVLNQKIIQQSSVVTSFYNSRLQDMSMAYGFVQDGNYALIAPSHDDQNSLDKILYWKNLTENQILDYLPETNVMAKDAMSYVPSMEGLAVYLKENKSKIDNMSDLLKN